MENYLDQHNATMAVIGSDKITQVGVQSHVHWTHSTLTTSQTLHFLHDTVTLCRINTHKAVQPFQFNTHTHTPHVTLHAQGSAPGSVIGSVALSLLRRVSQPVVLVTNNSFKLVSPKSEASKLGESGVCVCLSVCACACVFETCQLLLVWLSSSCSQETACPVKLRHSTNFCTMMHTHRLDHQAERR